MTYLCVGYRYIKLIKYEFYLSGTKVTDKS